LKRVIVFLIKIVLLLLVIIGLWSAYQYNQKIKYDEDSLFQEGDKYYYKDYTIDENVYEGKNIVEHHQPIIQKRYIAKKTVIINAHNSPKEQFECDGRRYCSQMTSCKEATFFINNCPNTRMDGDRDGIPCEGHWCRY